MKRFSLRLVCTLAVAAAVLSLASCGGSSDAGSEDEAASEGAASGGSGPEVRSAEGPPESYVRYRCSICSCRVFSGDGAYCNRPNCGHHWSDHQRPPG
jgi:hypothetical protein